MRHACKAKRLLLLLLAGVASCGGESSRSDEPGVVQMALAVGGSGAVAARVQATDTVDARVAFDRVFALGDRASMSTRFAVPAASYILRLELFPDAARTRLMAAGSERVEVKEGMTTHVRGRFDAAKPAPDGVGKIDLRSDQAPVIERVDVTFDPPKIVGESAPRNVHIQVTASDADGDSLRFLWSGLGLPGVVEGAADVIIEAAQAELGPPIVFIVVEDSAGAAAAAKVAFVPVRNCLLCGDFKVQILGSPKAELPEPASACLNAHSECTVGCDAIAVAVTGQPGAACAGRCGMSLSACLAE